MVRIGLQGLSEPKHGFVVLGLGNRLTCLFDGTMSFPHPVAATPAIGAEPEHTKNENGDDQFTHKLFGTVMTLGLFTNTAQLWDSINSANRNIGLVQRRERSRVSFFDCG